MRVLILLLMLAAVAQPQLRTVSSWKIWTHDGVTQQTFESVLGDAWADVPTTPSFPAMVLVYDEQTVSGDFRYGRKLRGRDFYCEVPRSVERDQHDGFTGSDAGESEAAFVSRVSCRAADLRKGLTILDEDWDAIVVEYNQWLKDNQ